MKLLDAKLFKEQNVKHSDSYSENLRLFRSQNKYKFLLDSKGKNNNPYCWLEYTCPSTGTIYLIDTFADFKTPLDAAKFHRPSLVPFEVPYEWNLFAN